MKGLFIGIMSGTSLDGADAVLVEFSEAGTAPGLLAAASVPFDDDLRRTLLDLQRSGPDELHRAAIAANALVDVHAHLVARLLGSTGLTAAAITAIGTHGQTVRHRPELGFTLQINAPARLAERSGATVVADFRSRDVAAGGQGAPLVPAFHANVFRDASEHRVVLNLGGMSNVTDLPSDRHAPVRGWDCGPGNVLLDGWIQRHRGLAYDESGHWAASGAVDDALFDRLATDSWFGRSPPKSTGRDRFDLAWLDAALRADGRPLAAPDVQATLAALSARVVVESVLRDAGAPDRMIVCGGGAYNADLIGRLGRAFAAAGHPVEIASSATAGIAPEHVEAMAFAWLAMRCVSDQPGNLPDVTGAIGLRVLGAIHPR